MRRISQQLFRLTGQLPEKVLLDVFGVKARINKLRDNSQLSVEDFEKLQEKLLLKTLYAAKNKICTVDQSKAVVKVISYRDIGQNEDDIKEILFTKTLLSIKELHAAF